MFEGFGYFPIEEDELEEIWTSLGTELKFLMQNYLKFVVVSCPDYMKLDEIQQQLKLPIRGYNTSKSTSLKAICLMCCQCWGHQFSHSLKPLISTNSA